MADPRSARNKDHLSEAEEILVEEEEQARRAAGEPVDGDGDGDKKKKNALPEIIVSDVAVIASREDLDRVLAAHQKWIEAVFDPRAEVAAGRANLKGVDLRGYDLRQANLSGANLAGAILTGCDLTRANLTVADLRGAQLQTANLSGAKLTRAKIDGTDLRGADLTGALLVGVDLSKAIMRSEGKDDEFAAPVAAETAATETAAPDAAASESAPTDEAAPRAGGLVDEAEGVRCATPQGADDGSDADGDDDFDGRAFAPAVAMPAPRALQGASRADDADDLEPADDEPGGAEGAVVEDGDAEPKETSER
jgi:hypothetical protein